MTDDNSWIVWMPGGDNAHLTPDQRAAAERMHRETQERRGRQLVTVTVEVFENGEAVPQVTVPKGSPLARINAQADRGAVNAAVAKAATALQHWR